MPQNQSVKPYQIKQGDTLQGIAYSQLGDPSKWQEIAIFNKLTYPYINETGGSLGKQAEGEVLFYVDAPVGVAVTIRKGTIVTTIPKATYGSGTLFSKKYMTKKDVVLAVSALNILADIYAMGYGEIGNVGEGEINTIMRDGPATGLNAAIKVRNQQAVTGGTTDKILSIGDMLLIPIFSDGGVISSVWPQGMTALDMILGVDLYLGGEGTDKPKDSRAITYNIYDKDLSIEASNALNGFAGMDLRKISGLSNLIQALKHRIVTSKGELPYHPEYRSLIPELIGKPGTSKRVEMIRTEAIATCYDDPRVENVIDLSVTKISTGAYEIEFTIQPIGVNSTVSGNFVATFRS